MGEIDDILAGHRHRHHFLLRPNVFMQNYANYQSQAIRTAPSTPLTADRRRALSIPATSPLWPPCVLTAPATHAGKAFTLTGAEAVATGIEARAIDRAAVGRPVA